MTELPPGAIELTLPYPVSANRYWATRLVKPRVGKARAMTYVTPDACAYKAQVAAIARSAGVLEPLKWRFHLDRWLYPHRPLDHAARLRRLGEYWDDDVRCIDLGNAEKILSDALQGVLFTDDRWLWSGTEQRMTPDGEARIVVRVTPLQRTQKGI